MQPHVAKTNRSIPRHPQGAPKIKVTLSMNGAAFELNIEGRRDRR